jgi:hypothetical protein
VILDVVCSGNHRLAHVVRTDEGLVVTGRFTSVELIRTGAELFEVTRRHGPPLSTGVAVLLDLTNENQGITVQCRCIEEVTIRVGWLRDQIVARRRRAVCASGR